MSRRAHRYLARLQGNTNSTKQRWYMETGVIGRDYLKHEQEHPDHSKCRTTVFVREYEPADNAEVLSIFYDGLMEMIPDTAFRALRHHPESLLLYSAVTVAVYLAFACWWVIVLAPAVVLCGRYIVSTHMTQRYLKNALRNDMGNIKEFYMKQPGFCFWVAVVEDKVVGTVAAAKEQKSDGVVVLRRMAVDQDYRQRGIGIALGQKLLEFAATNKSSSVVLGTTAYSPAAHKLYQKLGFRCVGVTNGYVTPGFGLSLLEKIFYRVSHHHYAFKLQNGDITNR